MSDLWLLAVHMAALGQIWLLVMMNYLFLEQQACQRLMVGIVSTEVEEEFTADTQEEKNDSAEDTIKTVRKAWQNDFTKVDIILSIFSV